MTIFPTKVLLATDSSEEVALAAQTAVEIAAKTGSELHVAHVRIPPYRPSYYEDIYIGDHLPQEEAELEREAEDLLKEQVGKTEAAGGSVARTHLRTGRPEAEITALAEEIGAGLIVVGSRGLGGMRRALMGSVSNSVVRHARCPVLVVRKEKR
ncbi:MAG: universal stress protein [Actinomycetota bacterium]|nr:universal stress protein [Actinomycetota bacterium]